MFVVVWGWIQIDADLFIRLADVAEMAMDTEERSVTILTLSSKYV